MSVIYSGGGGSSSIPELTSDPISPAPQSMWVLKTGGTGSGEPLGLLLALTTTSGVPLSYQLSYQTLEGTTIRTTLA
jgi:hypothetical protein